MILVRSGFIVPVHDAAALINGAAPFFPKGWNE